jgi:hypothetical protein
MFQVLTTEKLRKSDVLLCKLRRRDLLTELYDAWGNHGNSAFIFIVGGYLYARGTKTETSYAEGFIVGWRKALSTPLLAEDLNYVRILGKDLPE